MEEPKNFETFYATRIAPVADDLKQQDKEADNQGITMFVFVLLTILGFIFSVAGSWGWFGGLLTVLLLLAALYHINKYTKQDDAYTGNYKEKIIKEVIKYLQPNLIYKPQDFIDSKEYRRSNLFRHYYDYYDGDDYLQGVYKNVSFHSCELHTRVNNLYRSPDTVFKGLFFVAKINSGFTAGTYVWSHGHDQMGASIGEERYGLLAIPKVYEMRMHDTFFEQYFCVYSSNPAEAREILSAAMMERMVKFRQQINRRFVMSVVAGHCYVAIPFAEDLLEPASDPGDKEEIKKYFFTILLILSIVNQLELNRLT